MSTTLKVNTLTPAQEDALRVFHAEWYRYGTCTDSSDRPATEAAITRMYEIVGKPAPRFLWTDSPATGALAIALLSGKLGVKRPSAAATMNPLRDSLRDSLGDSLWDSLWDSLGDSLWGSLWNPLRDSLWDSLWGSLGDSLWGSLWGSLRDSLGDSLWGSLWDPLGDSLWDSLWGSLWDPLGDSLWGSLWDPLGDSLWGSLGDSLWGSLRDIVNNHSFWGQHEAYWIAYYLFPEDQRLVTYDPKHSEQLGLWATISRSTGWWFPYADVVICTERPTKVIQERVASSWPYGVDSRRLHCEDGPALEYRDGWKVYAWHGIRVPEWVITNPTTEMALKEPNSEIRRAALESIGWEKALKDLNLSPLSAAPDPGNEPHSLTLYRLPADFYGQPVNLLVMTNGSPDRDGNERIYAETVPANITDPVEAAAWQYGVSPNVYAQLARRT